MTQSNWLDQSEMVCSSSGGSAWGANAVLMSRLGQSIVVEENAAAETDDAATECARLPECTFGF